MNRDGSQAQALTNGREPVYGGLLSPDGRKVLCLAPDPERKGKRFGLFVLDIRQGKLVRVEQQPLDAEFMGFCWSPDGRRIAYACRQAHEKEDPNQETESYLIVADADGNNPTLLARERAGDADLITIGGLDWR